MEYDVLIVLIFGASLFFFFNSVGHLVAFKTESRNEQSENESIEDRVTKLEGIYGVLQVNNDVCEEKLKENEKKLEEEKIKLKNENVRSAKNEY